MQKVLFVLVLILSLYSGCSKDKAAQCSEMSFQKDIWPLISAHCNLPACHSGANSNALVLDSAVAYQNMTKSGTGYIYAGEPDRSLLYEQMISPGQSMPPSGPLDATLISKMKCWILQGAKNN